MTIIRPNWRPVAELPDSDHRPGRMLITIAGVCHHSGYDFGRVVVGDARMDPDGPQGFNGEDIRRLMRMGDMDSGEVTHWAPFTIAWAGCP